jgi:hypothetical protein
MANEPSTWLERLRANYFACRSKLISSIGVSVIPLTVGVAARGYWP